MIAVASQRLLLSRGETELDRVALVGGAYGLWFGVVHGYLFFVYPDWVLAYLQDGGQLYKPVAYLFLLLVLTSACASGALATGWLLRRGHRTLGLLLASTGFVGMIGVLAATWKQYGLVGTFDEFYLGKARPVGEVGPFQTVTTTSGFLVGIPFVALVAWRIVASRRKPMEPARS